MLSPLCQTSSRQMRALGKAAAGEQEGQAAVHKPCVVVVVRDKAEGDINAAQA